MNISFENSGFEIILDSVITFRTEGENAYWLAP